MIKKSLIIILARKGSQRLKNKNVLLFNRKPLICWTIEQAIRVKSISNKIIVSTDNADILKYKKKYNNVEFIKRPKYLSTNSASSFEVIKHICKKFKFAGNVILLQPTSPLRRDMDIIKVHKLLNKGYRPIFSVCKSLHNSSLMYYVNSKKKLTPISNEKKYVYFPNGAIYAADTNWININETFYTKDAYAYTMNDEDSIDIDLRHHFTMAEALFKKRKSN